MCEPRESWVLPDAYQPPPLSEDDKWLIERMLSRGPSPREAGWPKRPGAQVEIDFLTGQRPSEQWG